MMKGMLTYSQDQHKASLRLHFSGAVPGKQPDRRNIGIGPQPHHKPERSRAEAQQTRRIAHRPPGVDQS